MSPGTTDSRGILLKKLESEIQWQWKWEKLNRQFQFATIWLTSTFSFLVLALAICQVYLGDHPQMLITFAIAIFSALAIFMPSLSCSFKWERRQQFHDRLARKYEIIKLRLEMDMIELADAAKEFERLHAQSPESTVQNAP